MFANVFEPRKFRDAILFRFSKIESMLPIFCKSDKAVFSPMPGMPGMLSDLSPVNASKSIINSGGTPYFFSTDVQRSIRAYEVKKFTKRTLTQWFEKTTIPFDDKELVKILIDTKREDLAQRIEKRVDKMIKNGAIKEVKKFLKLRVNKDKSSSKVIGINEISSYLLNKQDLISTKEQIFIKTRQYSKRQSTWARGQMKDWQKVPSQDLTSYIKKFQKYHT